MRRVANQKPLAREDACTVSMRVLKTQVIYEHTTFLKLKNSTKRLRYMELPHRCKFTKKKMKLIS